MEDKKIIIDGQEITYVDRISEDEIEKNDEYLYEDTIDLTEIVSEIQNRNFGDDYE